MTLSHEAEGRGQQCIGSSTAPRIPVASITVAVSKMVDISDTSDNHL